MPVFEGVDRPAAALRQKPVLARVPSEAQDPYLEQLWPEAEQHLCLPYLDLVVQVAEEEAVCEE